MPLVLVFVGLHLSGIPEEWGFCITGVCLFFLHIKLLIMHNSFDENPINTNRILNEMKKEMKELRVSLREIFKEIRTRKKGENISRYLSISEVADLLNLHTSTVYRMVYSGKLPHTRLRRKLYIHEDHILGVFDEGD